MYHISKLMMAVKELSVKSQALLGISIFLVLFYIVKHILSRPKRLNFPVVEAPVWDYKSAVIGGTLKYPDTPFILGGRVILPISTLEEVRNLPENQISFSEMVKETLCVKHTGLAVDNPELVMATKIDLTRHIMSNLDGLQDEIRYALNKELGPCEDWTPSPTYMKLARVIALLSGRVFVGLPLSREEEWIDASVNYTRDVMMAREAIVRRPAIIRHLVAPFLPEVKSVRRYGERGAELLKPVIDEVLARRALGKSYQDDAESEKGTMVSWMLNYAEDKSARTMARNQMSLSFAAIFTTTGAVCHALFDLASRPEYIQPLRDEIQQVINEDGQDITANGFRNFKKQSIPKLRKLDSFLKESQRLSPPAISGMDRVTTAPLKLSTGHTIPKGAHFAFPSYAISLSPKSTMFSPSYNPASYTPPHEFDGFRFYKLRAMEGKENKHQFVTTSTDSIHFGHGLHSCPGRFFASNEIKIVLIELLRSWDVRLKGDVDGRGGVDKRPQDLQFEYLYSPNPTAELEFRRRRE